MRAPAFCRHCGHELDPGQRFCEGCGAEIAQPQPGVAAAETPAVAQDAALQSSQEPISAPPPVPAIPTQAAPPPSQPATQLGYAPPVTSRGSKGTSPLVLIAVSAIVVVVAIVAVVMLGGSDSDGGTTPSAMPLGLTVETISSWRERTAKDLYVTARIQYDLDLSKTPTGPRLSIARTVSGDLDLGQALKEALGGASLASVANDIEVAEEPRYVSVGKNSYGAAITLWRKRGGEKPIATRVIYVAAKQGGYVVTMEWPAEESSEDFTLLEGMVNNARFSDAAFTGSPPKGRAAGEAGPGWPLQARDTFGASYGAFGTSRMPFQVNAPINATGHTGTTIIRDGRFVIEGNSTATSRASAIHRVGSICTNCYVSVDIQNVGDSVSGYGLIMRYESDSLPGYRVTLQDSTNTFRVAYTDGAGTNEIIPSTRSDAIKPGQINRLAILLDGQRVVVWINGQKVGETNHGGQKSGTVGLYFVPNVVGRYAIAYDNFEFRAVE